MKIKAEQLKIKNTYAEEIVSRLGKNRLHVDNDLFLETVIRQLLSPLIDENCRFKVHGASLLLIENESGSVYLKEFEDLELDDNELISLGEFLYRSHSCPCSDL